MRSAKITIKDRRNPKRRVGAIVGYGPTRKKAEAAARKLAKLRGIPVLLKPPKKSNRRKARKKKTNRRRRR